MFVWLTMALSRPFKEDRQALPLSTPLSSRRSMVWLPDCQRLIVTVYPNSHSTPRHVDPSYAWGFIIEVVSSRSIVYFANGLIILRDLSILWEMVSFVHGVASIIFTYKDASIVGKGCAVIRNEPLYRPWASVASEARFQSSMSPKLLGHWTTRQFMGNTTYMYFLRCG